MKLDVKRTLVAVVLCLLTVPALGDSVLDIYFGAGMWNQDIDAQLTSNGFEVDADEDLGVDEESNQLFYIAIEHGVPVLPNVRAQHLDMDIDGTNVLSRSIAFNGRDFTLADSVNTAVQLQQTDAVFYYEVLDNVVSIDVGMTASFIEGSIDVASSVQNAHARFDEVIPMLYTGVRFDLPLTGMWVSAEAQGVSYNDNRLVEFSASLGYESDGGFGFEAGWRSIDIEMDAFDDIDTAQLEITGPFAALNFHF